MALDWKGRRQKLHSKKQSSHTAYTFWTDLEGLIKLTAHVTIWRSFPGELAQRPIGRQPKL